MKHTFSQHLCWVLLLCAFSLGRSEDEPVSRLPTTVARTTRQKRLEEQKNTIKSERTTIPFTPDEASSTTSFNMHWKDVKHRNRSLEHLSGNTVPVVGTTESSTKKQPKAKPGAPNLLSAMKMVTNINDPDILSPTGWALASMTKPPKRSTTLPTKPINNYWSTRFQKTTTPTPFNLTNIQLNNTITEKTNIENSTETFPDLPDNNLINVTKIEDKTENNTLIDQSTTSMTRPTNSTIKPYKETNHKITVPPSIGNDIPDDSSILKNNFTTPIPYLYTENNKIELKPTEIPNVVFNGTETTTMTTSSVTESTTQASPTTEAIQKPIVNYIEEITTQLEKNYTVSTTSIPIFNNTIKVITNKELNHTNEIFKLNIGTSSTESSKTNEIKTKILKDISQDIKIHKDLINKNDQHSHEFKIPKISIDKENHKEITIEKDNETSQDLKISKANVEKAENDSHNTKIPKITIDKEIMEEINNPKTETDEETSIDLNIPKIPLDKEKENSQDLEIPKLDIGKEKENSQDMEIPKIDDEKKKEDNLDLEIPKIDDEKKKEDNQDLEIPKINDEKKKEDNQDLEIPTEVETSKENSHVLEIPKIEKDKEDSQDLKIVKDLVEKIENFTIPKDLIESPIKNKEDKDDVKTTTETEIKETTEAMVTTKISNVTIEYENKTEHTPVYHEPDDDDESLMYNTTYNEKKPGFDEEDDVHKDLDGMVTTIVSDEILNETTTSETSTVSTTTHILDEDVTSPDNDRSNIDDDTIYDSMVPMNVKITIHATYKQMCEKKEALRDAIVKSFKSVLRDVDRKQIIILNLGEMECPSNLEGELVPVRIFFTDAQGQYDNTLTDTFVSLVRENHLDFIYPISKIEKEHEAFVDSPKLGGTVIAAIVISSIAGVCLLFLTILLVIMRKRQKGFNYGQRCTPVSLDDYSLDNISVYNSVRRKAIRASKRSYGNPAFDDPVALTNPLNFAGLSNMVNDKAKIEEEFSRVPVITVKPDELPLGAETKNRYANVIPLPETRVQLMKTNSSNVLDQFINANYVKGSKLVDKFYIACQAPMANTVADFWQMVWEQQTKIIIMLTDLHENGVEKCADYLPPSEVLDCHRVFGDLQVTLKKREVREKYIISSLQLKNLENNLWREVTHMWFASWPSRGVPDDLSSLIAFLIEARSYAKSGPPVVVHCSPGTGRTGTVIAIDIAIRDFETDRIVDIPKTVYSVRRDRAGAVQTSEQYKLIYQVIHFYATKLTGGVLDSI